MGRRPLLSATDADGPPEPWPEAEQPKPPEEERAEPKRGREGAGPGAWLRSSPACRVKGARRSSSADRRQDGGGCCARYWGCGLRRRRRGLSPRQGRPTLSSEVGIIICDISNPASLDEMATKTTLVLNCVGPYRFYGEPIVKACIENGTSYIDICGEPQFLELMQAKYHEKAAEKGVYIIGSSGFDSIPADLGVIYTRNKMNGTLTAVESFLTIHSGPEGLCIHDGTWKSAICGFGDKSSLRKLRSASCLKPVPIVGSKLKRRWPVSYCRELSTYSIPFLGSDTSVVKRTQRYLHENLEESPVQYAAYVTVGGITSVIKLMFAGLFFLVFVKFSIGRQLLVKFPWLFSFGYFSKQGPTQKQMDGTSFTMTFFGQGYSQGFSTDKNKPNIKICTQVKGPEAGYVATSIAMVQAAMTLLNDASHLPKGGGVFTPGAAFSRTKLIDRLNQHGIEFSVISSSEV
ncbi:saccharopine dehydrogenase-like oxidoreductase isoform X2 [Nannospalax galili]|uniref:saccharopine dehydrogenase-like oxidoreductase isoform X2 n=1 Tax=Nannospalax galili TaxID=1026970 RepID=UPI00111BD11D|nr:saccharopine dehydrogenase-like oxidoreductase isoform X2 [Nannospalax galili]